MIVVAEAARAGEVEAALAASALSPLRIGALAPRSGEAVVTHGKLAL